MIDRKALESGGISGHLMVMGALKGDCVGLGFPPTLRCSEFSAKTSAAVLVFFAGPAASESWLFFRLDGMVCRGTRCCLK